MMKSLAIFLITLYQKTLSPDHGWFKARYPHGFCRYYPSCSEYTKQAIEKFGVIRGGWMGFKRILKCNPWTEPSVDQIPNDKFQISNKFPIPKLKNFDI